MGKTVFLSHETCFLEKRNRKRNEIEAKPCTEEGGILFFRYIRFRLATTIFHFIRAHRIERFSFSLSTWLGISEILGEESIFDVNIIVQSVLIFLRSMQTSRSLTPPPGNGNFEKCVPLVSCGKTKSIVPNRIFENDFLPGSATSHFSAYSNSCDSSRTLRKSLSLTSASVVADKS